MITTLSINILKIFAAKLLFLLPHIKPSLTHTVQKAHSNVYTNLILQIPYIHWVTFLSMSIWVHFLKFLAVNC